MNKHAGLVLRNLLVYLILITGLLLLWSPLNNTDQNQPASTIQFVYQQF